MKTILFVIPDLQTGGVTTSFVNLLKLLRSNKDFNMSVLIMNDDSNDFVEKTANVYRLTGRAKLWNYSKKSKYFKNDFKSHFIGLIKKVLNKLSIWNKFCFSKTRIGKFDYVIGYKQSPAVIDLVRAIKGKRKICFWHGDPNYMFGISKWINKLAYVQQIACVSYYVKKQMAELFPKYADKLTVVMNSVDDTEIKKASSIQKNRFGSRYFNLITVSRFSNEDKNILLIPSIALKLKAHNVMFKWRLIGDGPDREELLKRISSNNVGDVIELISSSDVFDFIKSSDLFVLTSKTESFGLVILEALLLGTPCLCSDLPSVREIAGHNSGVIFSKNTTDSYCEIIEHLLADKTYYDDLLLKAKSFSYDNQRVYNQFCELMGYETR